MTQEQGYQKACIKELKPLVGKTVTSVIKDEDGNFGLEIGGTDLWIMMDPEGNGPGFPRVTKEQA